MRGSDEPDADDDYEDDVSSGIRGCFSSCYVAAEWHRPRLRVCLRDQGEMDAFAYSSSLIDPGKAGLAAKEAREHD